MNPNNVDPLNQQPINQVPPNEQPDPSAIPQPVTTPPLPGSPTGLPPEGAPMSAPAPMTPPIPEPNEPSKGVGHKKVLIPIIAFVILLILAGAAYLFVGRSNDDRPSTLDESSVVEDVVPEEVETESRPAKSEAPVNTSVKSDTGFTVSVTSVVRNFPSDQVDKEEEVVLLNMKIETDGTYTGAPGVSDMMVITDNGTTYKKTYAVPEKDLTAGGYTALPSASPKVGSPVSGYVAFAVPYKSTVSKFRYTRPTTKILGGETLPAKSFDANL